MLARVRTVLDRLNARTPDGGPRGLASVSGDDGAADDPATDDSDADTPPHLYECSSCDRVYVATDKRTCSTCDTAVGRVE